MTLIERYRAREELPTASCLLHLFADRLLPEQSLGARLLHQVAVPTPGTDTPVPLPPLENHLLAVAVYDLWTDGVIRCEFDGNPHRQEWVWMERDGEEPRTELGIEGHLLDLLPGEPVSLYELITESWLLDGWAFLPLNGILIDAQLEAAELGITGRPQTPDLTATGHTRFRPVTVDRRRLDRLERALDKAELGWLDAIVDGSLKPLVGHCHRVINAARPRGSSLLSTPPAGP